MIDDGMRVVGGIEVSACCVMMCGRLRGSERLVQARQYCMSRVTGLASSKNVTLDKTAAIPVTHPLLPPLRTRAVIKTLGRICLPLYEKKERHYDSSL